MNTKVKKTAIVIATYNRPQSLLRLLKSIANAIYSSDDITLVISIDYHPYYNKDVVQIAENFEWKQGNKKIIKHSTNLGLRKHILSCGDLSYEYENVIILEDDLFVSPYFYTYAQQALQFYENEEKICGISLYAYNFNFVANLNFYPINDSYSTYFIQHASSLGQIWSKKHWDKFLAWYKYNNETINKDLLIPDYVLRWPETSWKKYFIAYMVTNDLYFVFPKISLVTNFSLDKGTHTPGINNNVQVPILLMETNYYFAPYNEKALIYDVYFELSPIFLKKIAPCFLNYDFSMDIYGKKEKSKIKTEYLISVKKCKKTLKSFGIQMLPIELNIINNIEGKNIFLGKTIDFDENISFDNKYLLISTLQKKIHTRQLLTLLKHDFIKKLKL